MDSQFEGKIYNVLLPKPSCLYNISILANQGDLKTGDNFGLDLAGFFEHNTTYL